MLDDCCHICGRQFDTWFEFVEHLKTHSSKKVHFKKADSDLPFDEAVCRFIKKVVVTEIEDAVTCKACIKILKNIPHLKKM